MIQNLILAIDGGGICGLISLAILLRLLQTCPDLLQRCKLLAGTSTGGIIVLCLAAGIPASNILALYRDNGAAIFDQDFWQSVADGRGIWGAKYHNAKLHGLLFDILGNTTMDQLVTPVVVSSFCLDNNELDPAKRQWTPRFWTNKDAEVLVADVAMMTSAAPTYFPSYQHGGLWYVDGCVTGHVNPSLLALAYAGDSNTKLLSLGTGATMEHVSGVVHDGGDLQYLTRIGEMDLEGSRISSDILSRVALGDRYRRINPACNIAMDAWQQSSTLIQVGNQCDLGDVPEWLQDTPNGDAP